MGLLKKLNKQRRRRALRVRSNIDSSRMPRISVFRSARHIYAQVIDDSKGNTITSCSSGELSGQSGDKTTIAKEVGRELAKKMQAAGVDQVSFDRGRFLYHGRVKALADGLREGGIRV